MIARLFGPRKNSVNEVTPLLNSINSKKYFQEEEDSGDVEIHDGIDTFRPDMILMIASYLNMRDTAHLRVNRHYHTVLNRNEKITDLKRYSELNERLNEIYAARFFVLPRDRSRTCFGIYLTAALSAASLIGVVACFIASMITLNSIEFSESSEEINKEMTKYLVLLGGGGGGLLLTSVISFGVLDWMVGKQKRRLAEDSRAVVNELTQLKEMYPILRRNQP